MHVSCSISHLETTLFIQPPTKPWPISQLPSIAELLWGFTCLTAPACFPLPTPFPAILTAALTTLPLKPLYDLRFVK